MQKDPEEENLPPVSFFIRNSQKYNPELCDDTFPESVELILLRDNFVISQSRTPGTLLRNSSF